MRIGIISDIHSNLAALEAVLEDAARRAVAEFWCLGDVVGYGPAPRECVAIVRERARLCLAGNHDLGSIGAISLADFNPYAAEASQWTGQVLTEDEKAWLGGLPAKLAEGEWTLAHGSPREPVWEYVLSSAVARASFACFETRACLVGHSHVPFVCRETPFGEPCRLVHAPDGTEAPLGAERLIVNPGSVGQPRDGDPRAAYAILDMAQGLVAFHRAPYDIEAVQRQMRALGLPDYLADRLAHGR